MKHHPLTSIHLDRRLAASLQIQLTLGIKSLIQKGALPAGQPVPSTREVATDLKISRNTVIAAYDRLIGEGFLESRPRSGIVVSQFITSTEPARAAPSTQPQPHLNTSLKPFRPCQPDVRLFPLALWNRLRSRALRHHADRLLNYQSQSPLGLPALQQSIATYLRDSRGVACHPQQVAITSGSQQALFLLARLLLKPRDRVFLEDPGYLGARHAFAATGATLISIPVDAHGMTTPRAKLAPPALIYTTPSRQFPTGATLPLERRLALIEYAERNQAWILEDDYDSEFRYGRPPLPSLCSLHPNSRVIYIGTMSKVLFPSLRIGYAVVPHHLIEPVAAARAIIDDHGPLIDQATLAEFIDSGAFYTHIRRCRREYGARMSTFLEAARAADLPLLFPHADGGMNITGFFAPGSNDTATSATLAEAGFEIPSLAHYSLKPTRPGLAFGFTAFDHARIRHAIRHIAPILRVN